MSYDNDAPGADGDLRPSWPASADEYEVLLVDRPAPYVNRVTLNRPEKRNALNNKLRAELLHALQEGDDDPDVHVQIVRGASPASFTHCWAWLSRSPLPTMSRRVRLGMAWD